MKSSVGGAALSTGHGTRVALYARVSTRNNGQDPQTQIELLREYAARRAWTIAQEYVDEGYSGAKSDRPALNRLMKDARRRGFDAIAVYKFDRFGRSLRHLVNALDEFRSLGIEFVSITEAIDTASPLGHVMFALIGAMAQFERELIRERVTMGIDRARRQGKRIGRPRVDVPYETLRRLRHDERLSLRAIAKATGISPTTVMEMLREMDINVQARRLPTRP
jgi:DNA invertase Pin-like site-specific DNA recombinase